MLAFAPAGSSHAQSPDELEQARRHFDAGLEHARRGGWDAAALAFAQAYALAPRAAVLFNLAGAQLRTGHMLESHANYHRFLRLEDPSITRAHRTAVQGQIAHIEQRIPRLRVSIEGLGPQDRVLLDKQRLYVNDLDLDQWVNPGAHVVTVYRVDGATQVHRVTVVEGEHKTLAIRLR